MDRRLLALLLGIVLPAAALLVWKGREGGAPAGPAQEDAARESGMGGPLIRWERDYAKALSDARREGKPLLLYFTAEW